MERGHAPTASGSSFVSKKSNFKGITGVYDESEKTKAIKRRKCIITGGIHPDVTTESP